MIGGASSRKHGFQPYTFLISERLVIFLFSLPMRQILEERTPWFYVSDRFFLSLSPEVKCLLPRLGTAPNFMEITDVQSGLDYWKWRKWTKTSTEKSVKVYRRRQFLGKVSWKQIKILEGCQSPRQISVIKRLWIRVFWLLFLCGYRVIFSSAVFALVVPTIMYQVSIYQGH